MSQTYSMEVEHDLGTHGAVRAMERACTHYAQAYPQAGIIWKKPTLNDFEVTLRVAGVDGVIRGRALPDKVTLSLEAPDGLSVPEILLRAFIRKEARKWLTG